MSQSIFPLLITNSFIPSLWRLSTDALTREYADLNYVKFPIAQGSETFPADISVSGTTNLGLTNINNNSLVITDGTTTNTINKSGYTTRNSTQNSSHYLNFSDSSSTGVGAIQKSANFVVNPSTGLLTIPDLRLNNDNIHLGNDAGLTNQGIDSVAIGTDAGQINQGINSVAIGPEAGQINQGINSVAIGYQAGTTQTYDCVAIGYGAGNTNQGNNCLALGALAGQINQGNNSVAIGANSGQINLGDYSIAIGYNSEAKGDYSIAIGDTAGGSNLGEYSIAIGKDSVGTGNNSISIGRGANTSTYTNSVAIGIGATSGANNQITLGTASQNVSVPGATANIKNLITSTSTGALVVAGGGAFGSGITTGDTTNLAFSVAGGGGFRFLEIDTGDDECVLDFHSQNTRTTDYDARIKSTGGTASIGQGDLTLDSATTTITGTTTISNKDLIITDGTTTNTINKTGYTTKNSAQNSNHYLNFSDSSSTGVGAIQKSANFVVNPSTGTFSASGLITANGGLTMGGANNITLGAGTTAPTAGQLGYRITGTILSTTITAGSETIISTITLTPGVWILTAGLKANTNQTITTPANVLSTWILIQVGSSQYSFGGLARSPTNNFYNAVSTTYIVSSGTQAANLIFNPNTNTSISTSSGQSYYYAIRIA